MSVKLMTLCMIRKDGKILLAMKKRGFGAGRWNGYGGKVEEGETIEEAAKREIWQEGKITVEEIEEMGVLNFEFKKNPGNILQVHIFRAGGFSGEPQETEEMKPEWFDEDKIPYEEMWSDDIYWLPTFLENKKFKGRFLFDDNDQVLEKNVEILEKEKNQEFKIK